jgi:tetratricopeptide (TPR) repeat protein
LLEQWLAKAKNDSIKVDQLNIVAQYYSSREPNKGRHYANEALRLSLGWGYKKGIAAAYANLGHYYLFSADYDSAVTYLQKAMEVHRETNDYEKLTGIYIKLGNAYDNLSNYPNALNFYFKALKLAENQGNTDDEATALVCVGNIFKFQGNYKQSLVELFRGLSLYQADSNITGEKFALNCIGNVYYEQSDFKNALKYYRKSLAIAEKIGDKANIAQGLINIGNVFSEENKNELALEYQFKALKIYEAINDRSGGANLLGNIATTYLMIASNATDTIAAQALIPAGKEANVKMAIAYFKQAIEQEQQLGELNTLQQFYQNIAEAYALAGDFESAYLSFQRASVIKDSLFSNENSIKLYNIVKERELDKQKEIDTLKEQNRYRERTFYAVGIVLLLIVLTIIGKGYTTQKHLNTTINKLVNEQEHTILERTKELAVSYEQLEVSSAKLAEYNKKLVELIQFNAHNMREPLTRVMGAIIVQEYVSQEEFNAEIWPDLRRSVNDLDKIIKEVITRADETIAQNS